VVSKEEVIPELLKYREELLKDERRRLVDDPEADAFVKADPFAFLLAACTDRGEPFEQVWKRPLQVYRQLGHLSPQKLAEMDQTEIETILRSLRPIPRFPHQKARTVRELAVFIVNELGGDAKAFWEGKPVRQVKDDLDNLYGVGQGIANMTVRLLIDNLGWDPGTQELRDIDVKPDVNLLRVFHRSGLIARQGDEDEAVRIAHKWSPEFPGALDWPAWDIGWRWCHESVPECLKCVLREVCPKVGV
jgi:endonuclease-3